LVSLQLWKEDEVILHLCTNKQQMLTCNQIYELAPLHPRRLAKSPRKDDKEKVAQGVPSNMYNETYMNEMNKNEK